MAYRKQFSIDDPSRKFVLDKEIKEERDKEP